MWMLKILLLAAGLSLAANAIIYRFFVKNSPFLAKGFKFFSFVAGIYLIAFLLNFLLSSNNFHSFRWGFFLFLLFALPQLIFFVYWLFFVLPLFKFPAAQGLAMLVGCGIFLIAFSLILHGGLIGRTKIITTEVTVASPKLPPEFDGFRIVQFSDLHLGSLTDKPEFVANLVAEINNLQADMIVFTGDLVNDRSNELADFLPILAEIQAPYGVYSILGNHDYGDYVRWSSLNEKQQNLQQLLQLQTDMGWIMLNDQNTIITKNGASLALVGVENWGDPPFKTYGNLQAAYQNVDKSLFTVLLSHNPAHWREEVLPDTKIDLMLAGHTHAMQVKIAGFSPARFRYREWSGLYQQDGRYLYVNEGIGTVFVPMRIGAYPELTVIELKKV